MLKRNLIANYLGHGWSSVMNIAFIPIYIKYLGVEAYGVIGLFALMQAALALFDVGMTPTLAREMALFKGGKRSIQSIRDLLRSIEIIALIIALFAITLLFYSANWIANNWINAQKMPTDAIESAFILMGLVGAIRFVENIYKSSLVGLQHQISLNIANSALATLRGPGVIGVLAWLSSSIEAFFIWQAIISFISLIVFNLITYRSLPPTAQKGRFSCDELRNVWHFARGMFGVALLSALLMQVDKLLLSNLLSLVDYGYYSLATTAASVIYVVITPIVQAYYPRFCEFYARNDQIRLADTYHQAAQLISTLAGSIAIVIAVFAETVLRLWSNDPEIARTTATLLRILICGNLLNGLMSVPYQAQLAHGWTSLTIWINATAVAFFIPTIIWATSRYGAEGAAWTWLTLNAGYVLIGLHLMYRRILSSEKWLWYRQDVLLPLCTGGFWAISLYQISPIGSNFTADLIFLIFSWITTLCVALFSARHLRYKINHALIILLAK